MEADTTQNEIDRLVAIWVQSQKTEDLTSLWKATLNLNQWHFITKYTDDLQDRKPFVGVIENKPWVFVFTDRSKAAKYCQQDSSWGFVDKNGSAMVIAMETSKAIAYINELSSLGVYGMRFNEGNGFFSPISNLNSIIEYVKSH